MHNKVSRVHYDNDFENVEWNLEHHVENPNRIMQRILIKITSFL